MDDRSYRLPWIIASGVLLGGIALIGLSLRSRLYETARSEAGWQAAALLQSAQDVLRLSEKEVEARVAGAASLRTVRTLVATEVDQATFQDAFATEEWWQSVRADFPLQQLVLGDGQFDFTVQPVQLRLDDLLAAVRRRSPVSQILVTNSAAYFVAAASIDAQPRTQREPAFLILGRPLAPRDLTPSRRMGGAAVLSVDRIGLFGMGLAPQIQHLQELIQRGGSGALVANNAEWATASVEVAPKLQLSVEADTADKARDLARAIRTLLFPLWGIGALLAVVCLYIGIGKRPRPREPKPSDPTAADADEVSTELLPQDLSRGESAMSPRLRPVDPYSGAEAGASDSKQFGRYRLLHVLSEGSAIRAELGVLRGAQGFNRLFVIKRLRGELAHQSAAVSEFVEGAQLGSSLVHSNIIPIYDFGRVGDEYFVAQEHVLGRDLETLVRRTNESDGVSLPPLLAFYIAQEVLKALAYAHSQHNSRGEPAPIVHGNICPQKIWLSALGEVKLLDFGLSHRGAASDGTPGRLIFIAPEQARGETVEPRSDLFSLGLTMFWSLTGRSLYSAKSRQELLEKARKGPGREEFDSISLLAGPATHVLRRALEADPARRFQTAEQFARAIPPWDLSRVEERLQSLMRRRFEQDFLEEQARYSDSQTGPGDLSVSEGQSGSR